MLPSSECGLYLMDDMFFLVVALKQTLNFLHSSLSVIQQEIFKKIVLIVHTWDESNFYLHFETKDI